MIAVARFVAFAAKELHDRPEWRRRIATETAERNSLVGGSSATAFAQEIRRTAPFVPMLPGWAATDTELGGNRVPAGGRVVFDILGTEYGRSFVGTCPVSSFPSAHWYRGLRGADGFCTAWWFRRRKRPPLPGRETRHRGARFRHRDTEQLREAGIAGSIGTVGDALDNALMESTIGLFKTELIHAVGVPSWSSRQHVETATAAWVDWFNYRRLHSSIGHQTPVEYETEYHQTHAQKPLVA